MRGTCSISIPSHLFQTDLTRITKESVPGVGWLQLRVIQCSADEASVTSHALCMLSLEWVKRQMEEEQLSLDALKEKVGNFVDSELNNQNTLN